MKKLLLLLFLSNIGCSAIKEYSSYEIAEIVYIDQNYYDGLEKDILDSQELKAQLDMTDKVNLDIYNDLVDRHNKLVLKISKQIKRQRDVNYDGNLRLELDNLRISYQMAKRRIVTDLPVDYNVPYAFIIELFLNEAKKMFIADQYAKLFVEKFSIDG